MSDLPLDMSRAGLDGRIGPRSQHEWCFFGDPKVEKQSVLEVVCIDLGHLIISNITIVNI